MALTGKQLQTLQQVARREIDGTRGKDGWRFADQSSAGACSNAVMSLSAKALVSIEYLEATATVVMTERGRNLLNRETRHA